METKLHWEDIMSYFFKFTMELGVDWTTVKDCEYCKNLEGPKWRKWRKSGLHRKMSQNSSCCWWWCSVTKSCPSLCDPMDGSTPGFSVLHCLPGFAQIHAHWVGKAIQPSHPLSPPSPSAFNLSQHQGLFQWVGSLHQEVKVLELQLQHQSFQWMFRVDCL